MPPTAEALDAALRRLGYTEFRPGQREAVETLLEVGRLLLVAPTGGGKSLAYQLPATLFDGTSVVISPLIALMHDQVAALEQRGIPATYLASTLDGAEIRRRLAAVARREVRLVYVAPERLGDGAFRRILQEVAPPLVAVDEAHCISEWGHDFRPEYLAIGDVIGALPEARVLACTATATPVVRDEILARLGLAPDTPQIVRGFARPNLILRAAEVRGKRDRRQHLDALLAEALGSPGDARGLAIVYSPTRRMAEEEHARLADVGWRAACYHAGLSPEARQSAQARFSDGRLDVVVATNAFGMGIDRPDVRAVVHLGPPGSIEAYYQEVGRAGRDGEPAHGLLLTSPSDLPLRRRLLESPVDGREPSAAVVEHKWGMFLELVRWAEGGSCRHDAILRYFGDEAETTGGCGRCDACQRFDDAPEDPEETSLVVRKALSGVARVHGRFGLAVAVKLLRGERDDRLSRSGLEAVSTFGILSDRPAPWLVRLLQRCVTAGWVSFTAGDRPVVVLTAEGNDVMRERRPARVALPPTAPLPRAERPVRTGRRRAPPDALDAAATELFEALRGHRLRVAKDEGVPPYVVASDRTLRDLATLRPRTRGELLTVHGIGEAKADRFGEGLLEVVALHRGSVADQR